MLKLDEYVQNPSTSVNNASHPYTQPKAAVGSGQMYQNIRQVIRTAALLGTGLSLICFCSRTVDDFVAQTLGLPLDLLTVGSLLLCFITQYTKIFKPEADRPQEVIKIIPPDAHQRAGLEEPLSQIALSLGRISDHLDQQYREREKLIDTNKEATGQLIKMAKLFAQRSDTLEKSLEQRLAHLAYSQYELSTFATQLDQKLSSSIATLAARADKADHIVSEQLQMNVNQAEQAKSFLYLVEGLKKNMEGKLQAIAGEQRQFNQTVSGQLQQLADEIQQTRQASMKREKKAKQDLAQLRQQVTSQIVEFTELANQNLSAFSKNHVPSNAKSIEQRLAERKEQLAKAQNGVPDSERVLREISNQKSSNF